MPVTNWIQKKAGTDSTQPLLVGTLRIGIFWGYYNMTTRCTLDAGSVRVIEHALGMLECDLERAGGLASEAVLVVHAWLRDVQRALRAIEEPTVH